ncbi:MAG: putative Ig domain-containing protein [Microcoleus vaginatus WJT46-NPBG5]|nr:putative Ig domain-containing protein [Microcoleus vaginatus WJT46-NPBG5]
MPEIRGSFERDSLNGALVNDTIIGLAGEDELLGLELDDWMGGNTGDDLLNGNTGSDTVRGGKGNDTVHGGKENDWLYGDLGRDTVCGDIGDDTVIGGNGNNHKPNDSISSLNQQTIKEDESDLLFGNAGNDYINGNADNDTVYGGEGNDILHGGKNDDQLFGNLDDDRVRGDLGNDTGLGEEGNDQLVGGAGEDYLNGNTEDDWVAGNEGNDTVHGGQGNDTVHGGKDNDLLFGDLGNDVIIGDLGSDTLNGGEGDDTFVIGRRDDVAGYRTTGGINIADADWVLDFGTGSDKFQLIGGITFDDLNIFAGTGEYAGYTIIQDKVLGEYLAILKGFTGTLSRENFITATPTSPTSPNGDGTDTPTLPGGEGPDTPTLPGGEGPDTPTVPGGEGPDTPTLPGGEGPDTPTVPGGEGPDTPTLPGGEGPDTPTVPGGEGPDTPTSVTPSDILLSSVAVNENSPAGTLIGSLSASDPDAEDTHTYALLDNAGGRFIIDGNQLKVAPGALLDFETESSHTIKVRVTDAAGNIFDKDFTITLQNTNEAPRVANPIADLNTPEDSVFNFTFAGTTFNDPDGNPLTYTAKLTNGAILPAWLTFNPATRTFSGTPTNEDVGTLSIEVEASDGNGGRVSETFNLEIDNVNNPPTVVNPIAELNTPENSVFNFTFVGTTFNDPDGDSLAYTATLTGGAPLPAWLTFNPATRTFSGTPTDGDVGTLSIDVKASDGNGGTATDTFNLVIDNIDPTNNEPTVVNPITDLNTLEDATFNFTFAGTTFNDPDGDPLTYTAKLTNGATLPAWLTFNPTTRTFNGTPTNEDVGTLSIDVEASDGKGGRVIDTFNLVIGNVNDVPTVVNPIAGLNTLEDATFNFTFDVDTFNDIDGDALTYTATLNGGAALPAWLTFNPATRTFSGTPANGDVGTLSIDVQASDGNGGSVINTFNLVIDNVNDEPTVATAIAQQNTNAGTAFNFTFDVNTFNDIDGDPLTYTAKLTNGATLPAWLTFNPATRTFSGTPTNGDAGTLSIAVQASDDNGGSVTDTFVLEINNVGNNLPVVVNPIADLNGTQNAAFNFTFDANTFNDIDGDALTYTTTLTGGAALPAWLTFNPITRTFSGTPTNGDVGTLSIAVQASDGKGGSAIDTFDLVIGPIEPPPVNRIPDQNTLEDSVFNFTFAETTFNDPDGDGLTYTATQTGGAALPAWLTFNPATRTFSGTPANGDVGALSIDVQASDGNGGSAIDTFNLVINNVNDAPIVGNLITDQNVNENSPFTLNVSSNFSDPDGDSLTYTATLTGGGALPAWLTFDPTTGTFNGTPTNGDVGTLSIDVQASDGNGGSAIDTFILGVNNVNNPPFVVNPIADLNTPEDSAFNFTLAANTFTDPDGDALTYTATLTGGAALPAWLTFDPTTRTFSGTPANGDVGTLSIDVQASDGNGGIAIDTFILGVTNTNDVPTVANPIADLNTPEDSAFNFTFVETTFNDPDGDALTYTATLSNGGAPLPAWLTFDPTTRTFSGTPTQGDVGPLSIDVQASDGNGGIATDTFGLVVDNVNDPPILVTAIADQNANAGTAYNFTFDVNTFNDPDGDVLTYTATLTGGAALPAWLIFDPTTRTFSGTPTQGDVGPLSIDVQVSDGNGGSVIDTFNLTVGAFNTPPEAAEDIITTPVLLSSRLEIPVATLLANDTDIDVPANTLTITAVTAANGTASINNGIITYRATPGFAGPTTLAYTVSDGNGGTAIGTVRLNVAAGVELNAIATGTNVPVGSGGFSINGQAAFEWAGFSVNGAGDVNGDGFADVIIGAPYAAAPGLQSGKSYVVFGGPSGTTGGFVINGQAEGDRSGFSVSGAGDVNGDGLADLIIGADRADPSGLSSGRSYVVFGKANNTAVNLAAVAANPGNGGFVINGNSIGIRSGASVNSAGDVNGDGLDDLIVGAPDFGRDANGNGALDRNEIVGSGRAYVVFGKRANTVPVSLNDISNGTGGFAITSEAAGDQAGISVSSAGDLNGDGLADLIVGAEWADPNGNYAGGRAYVVYGKANNTTAVALTAVTGNAGGFAINGQATNDRLGRSVSEAGDVNGDGYADVIVGAYNADPNQTSPGRSYVVFGGPSGNNGGFTINGETAGDHAGISVSSAGDVNGDGLDDLIVGARWADPNGAYSGKSYVVFGKTDNTAVNLSAVAAGVGGFALNGASATDLSGRSVSGAGDLNGDGFADLIVGGFGADPSGNYSGASYVVYGGDFTASVTQMGTAAVDVLTGTAAADILVGGLANDQLIGNGGADVLYGGAGDDIVVISDTGLRRIDGGLGTDTLWLGGAGMALDLTAIRDPLIQGIERINMTGAGNNILSLGARDVISLSGSTSTLTVEGNAGDIVNASGFTFAGTANGFNQYTTSSATLLVQAGVTVNVLL